MPECCSVVISLARDDVFTRSVKITLKTSRHFFGETSLMWQPCKIAMVLVVGSLAMLGPASAQSVPPRSVQASATTGTAQAVVVGPGPLIHTAQVLPLDEQGQLVGVGRPQDQVERAFENLRAVLSAGGGNLDRVVKLNVY